MDVLATERGILHPITHSRLEVLQSREPRNHSASLSACNCTSSLVASTDLPIITRSGDYPQWDAYLLKVYAGPITYPVNLRRFAWFYRCGCAHLTASCEPTSSACGKTASKTAGRRRCMSRPQAPFGADIIPQSRERGARELCSASGVVQAFHGDSKYDALVVAAASRLMEYGFFMHPVAGASMSHEAKPLHDEWVEVIRVRQQVEYGTGATWYYHAPGSGVWLSLGVTCAATSLTHHGRVHSAPCTLGKTGRSCFDAEIVRHGKLRNCSTVQRKLSASSPALEIIDLRGMAPYAGVCPSNKLAALRAGWNASLSCTHCSEVTAVVNCAA